MAYSVPDDLSDAIDLISPTAYFGNTKTAHRKSLKSDWESLEARGARSSCETNVTVKSFINGKTIHQLAYGPACLRAQYNLGNYKVDPSSGSTIGFGSFLNQSASYTDLAKFEKSFDLQPENFTVTTIHGGRNDEMRNASNVEADLDVQAIVSLANGLPVKEYITGV